MTNRAKANLGKKFETLIENANKQYKFAGLALIEKQEVANKFINGKMIYSNKAAPDFMGAVKGGRAIVFDAKSTKGQSFPLANITRRMHQLDFLKGMEQLGAYSFYLIEFADYGKYFILPINTAVACIERAEAGGRKSIALHEFVLEVKGTFTNALDYLAALPAAK